eukprot:scaffold24002_cov25-Attheya_sp.AAC.1
MRKLCPPAKGLDRRPRLVLVFQKPSILTYRDGSEQKAMTKRMSSQGYSSVTWFSRATDYGSPILQDWCLTVFVRQDCMEERGFPKQPPPFGLPTRPMSNVLLPFGAPQWSWRDASLFVPSSSTPLPLDPLNSAPILVGSVSKHLKSSKLPTTYPVYGPSGPMPLEPEAHVKMLRGIRQIVPQERAMPLGFPKSWYQDLTLERAVQHSVSVNLLHALGSSIEEWLFPNVCPDPSIIPGDPISEPTLQDPIEDDKEWEWTLPDLPKGGDCYVARLANLRTAIHMAYPTESFDLLMEEGRQALAHHRLNYGPEGPRKLQILWWEWFPEIWDRLRHGFPMNFVSEPRHDKQPNSHMTPDQVTTASAFLDELIDLGVLVEESDLSRILSTIPLFLVPKPIVDLSSGKEDWRVIADMKAGGQNAFVAKDPVHLHGPQDILPQLYTGGWSAVSDASKYFHIYPTSQADRPHLHLVVLHPRSQKYYVWHGLPMGAGNSPAAAGAGGNGFIRSLYERCEAFQGVPRDNTFVSILQGDPYKPKWSHSRILIGKDGLPAARIWVHVDDFLIHAPTRAKCNLALGAFMDRAVSCGLLCHRRKTKSPAQRQDYV